MIRKRVAALAGATVAISALVPLSGHASTFDDRTLSYPPPDQRIAATDATFNSIEAKVRNNQSLISNFPNWTSQEDILDYNVHDLWHKGIDGSGTTIAFIVTEPDPDLQAALDRYDAALNLPPANVTEMTLPKGTPGQACQVECTEGEDQLDAESIHAMAPYAKLLFISPPVPETIGMQGWPQIAQAIKMISNQHLADVISVSMGDGEGDFDQDPTNPGVKARDAIHSLDPALLDAAANNIPVLFAAGDCGPTEAPVLNTKGQCTPAIGKTADHPSDSPWVTSVGGTIPNAGVSKTGGRTAPDGLWVQGTGGNPDAAGAGVSSLYQQPYWQKTNPALKGVPGRAYPDISMDASNGTSQATPTFAGILALATQMHHGPLGPINVALANMGPHGLADGIVDVPAGYNNNAYYVDGYSTAKGYDIASGWGTVNAPNFVPALVRTINSEAGGATPADWARNQLHRLQTQQTTVSAAGGVTTVTGKGFIPGSTPNGTTIRDGFGVFPAIPGQYQTQCGTLAWIGKGTCGPFVDPNATTPGQHWDTVTAQVTGPGGSTVPANDVTVSGPDLTGKVTVQVATSQLAPGTYSVALVGDVLTERTTFTVRH